MLWSISAEKDRTPRAIYRSKGNILAQRRPENLYCAGCAGKGKGLVFDTDCTDYTVSVLFNPGTRIEKRAIHFVERKTV
jgi:hypothetical protein